MAVCSAACAHLFLFPVWPGLTAVPVCAVTSGSLCSETYPNVPFGYTDSTGAKVSTLLT